MNENKEKCGVLALVSQESYTTDFLLKYLANIQHRGRESFGICFKDSNKILKSYTFMDLISVARKTMDNDFLSNQTNLALLHTRYSTSGEKKAGLIDSMPMIENHKLENIGAFSFAFNGNIPYNLNYFDLPELSCCDELRDNYVDTKMILAFIKNCVDGVNSIEDVLIKFVNTFPRAYSLVLINKNNLYVVKDRYGLKPLCIGKKNESYCVASESVALLEGYDYLKEVRNGEILKINNKVEVVYKYQKSKKSYCLFEYIYFMKDNSDSYYNETENIKVASIRYKFGEKLAEFEDIDYLNKIVIGVPSTGRSSAIGFADKLDIPLLDGLLKNPKSNRTFILGSDSERNKAANEKYLINRDIINNRDIFLIDDSIVRGITMKNIIIKLREAGAKSIHLRISSPEIKGICYYGVDIPSKEELIANNLTIIKMEKELNVDSLRYLSLKDMLSVFPKSKRKSFCSGCIDGNYNYNKDIEDLF